MICAGPASRDEGAGLTARGPPALVAAVGHDKAGALAVLQQSIVPDLVTETPVTGLHAANAPCACLTEHDACIHVDMA